MPSAAKARLAIFASGGGSNADQICTFFQHHASIHVECIVTNNPDAGVRQVAATHQKPFYLVPKRRWNEPELVLSILEGHDITHIILAGFLLLVPDWLIRHYPHRIINIHPALLPKYGGKGMYGHHVHKAVKSSGDPESGITIHEVDEHYDQGKIIFQHRVPLEKDDSPEEIARKVLKVEHYYYPRVIEAWLQP